MSGSYQQGTQPSPNRNIAILPAAISSMTLAYPLAFSRKDLSNQERIKYTYEWVTFENIWTYNYSVSTMNGINQSYTYSPWQYQNINERLAYSNGQLAHISYYSTAALTGAFYNINQ